MSYAIYQIKESKLREFGFVGYDYVIKHYGKVDLDNYEKIYERESELANLDAIFEKFNIDRPSDFKGHSLSMSDIVELNGKMYYCDTFGWVQL